VRMNKIEREAIKVLDFCIKQRKKTRIIVSSAREVFRHRCHHCPRLCVIVIVLSSEKAYTCFWIQDSYFSCLQSSELDASQEENSLCLGPLFSSFSRSCYLKECLLRRFPSLLDTTSYLLPISTELNHPISSIYFIILSEIFPFS